MRSLFYILFLLLLPMCGWGQGNIITTIAGKGTPGYSGDGGPAIDAEFYFPVSLCLDNSGNVYIADGFNHRIRKIDFTTGSIITVAGTGIGGYNGDGIIATNAQLLVPNGVFTDSIGDIYIADGLNHRIRKITISDGIISTIAGIGTAGYSGDGTAATNAKLNGSGSVSLDRAGNIYIADYFNHRIRKVEAGTGIITTVAGNGISGYSGDGGLAINAKISEPGQAFPDNDGNIFFTEVNNSVVRKVNISSGIISTICGTGIAGYSGDNGLAINATLKQPYGIFIDSVNNIYIDEWGNGTIRKIDGATGIITTVAGCGIQGFSGDGDLATNAKLQPDGVWVDRYGTIFIADMDNNRIRKVYNPQLSINTPAQSIEDIHLYPNPTRNEITITTTKEIESIEVVNMLGQTIETSPSFGYRSGQAHPKEREVLFSVAHLPAGIYFVKLNGVYAGKFVKE